MIIRVHILKMYIEQSFGRNVRHELSKLSSGVNSVSVSSMFQLNFVSFSEISHIAQNKPTTDSSTDPYIT